MSAAPARVIAGDHAHPVPSGRRNAEGRIVRAESRRLTPVVILGGIAALGIVFAVLLEQVVLAQSAFKLARLRADVVAAEARNHQLLLDASKLQNAERIEQYARDQLGMVPARSASAEYIVADVARRSAPVTGRGEPEAAAGIAARAPAEETSP